MAAVSYVIPVGWDWAAKSPDFVAPSPLLRSISRGAPVHIPTIEAGKLRKTHDAGKNANIALQDTRETMKNNPISMETVVGESPLHVDTLFLEAGARVRRDKHFREPIPSSFG